MVLQLDNLLPERYIFKVVCNTWTRGIRNTVPGSQATMSRKEVRSLV